MAFTVGVLILGLWSIGSGGRSVFALSSAASKPSLLADQPVSTLLSKESTRIAALKDEAKRIASAVAPEEDVYYLRYCLANPNDDDAATAALESNMKWRNSNEGSRICGAASKAVAEAMSGGGWNNEVVRAGAPYANIVNQFVTPAQIVTTSIPETGDLVYCIRAGQIDDVSLMSKVSVEQMTEFFLYCKEVHSIVANKRSEALNRLISVITANDLTGVKLVGGDASFRTSLSQSSKIANGLYPALAGPTLLLNLPALLGALLKLFTPLFPEEVRKRLRFERGPLENVDELTKILVEGGDERTKFLADMDRLVYGD